MNIDVIKNENQFFNKFDTTKFIISVLAIFLVIVEYVISDQGGTVSSWGSVNNVNLFGINISNVNLFFVLCVLGNFIILLTSFSFLESNIGLFNRKQIQTIGLLIYLLGVLTYFDYLFFEPFLLLYLGIVAVIYYALVTGFSFNILGSTFSIQYVSRINLINF